MRPICIFIHLHISYLINLNFFSSNFYRLLDSGHRYRPVHRPVQWTPSEAPLRLKVLGCLKFVEKCVNFRRCIAGIMKTKASA